MLRFLRKIRRRRRLRSEWETELAFHQELSAAAGNPIQLRDSLFLREQALDPWRFIFLENLWRDFVYALRGFQRTTGFVLVVTLTLALGIGANAAIFSAMDVVLLRSLPVERPEALEQITLVDGRNTSVTLSYPMFRGLLAAHGAFSDLFARLTAPVSLLAGGQPDRGIVEVVSGNYFSALGVRAHLGRLFVPQDDVVPLRDAVVVLSFDAWKQRFFADPNVVGKTIHINNNWFTIVGVAAPGFYGLETGTSPDAWVPAMMQPAVFGPSGRASFDEMDWRCWSVFGRRNPGVSEPQAQAAAELAFLRLQQETPATVSSHPPAGSVRLLSAAKGLSRLRNTFKEPILVLIALVSLVLLIACTNIASLLIARSVARRHETALRIALGAARIRMIQQSLTESLLLSALGGLLGAAIAPMGIRSLLRFLPSDRIPITLHVSLDIRVLVFSAAVSLVAGLLFGVTPALYGSKTEIAQSMKRNALVSVISRRFEIRKILITLQVALSLLLVVAAGLFVESLRKAISADIGLRTESVITATVNPAQIGYTQPQIKSFYDRLEARLEQISGVQFAGMSENALLSGGYEEFPVTVQDSAGGSQSGSVLVNKVGGDFFSATGIGILRGSNFGPRISPDTPLAAIINETAARQFFGDAEPIGRKLSLAPRLPQEVEIIGIARDAKYRSVREDVPGTLYLSFLQETSPTRERIIYLRVQGDSAHYIGPLREAIHDLDSALPIYELKTFETQKAQSLLIERLVATISGFFGTLALILAAIGLYGVISYGVQTRTREIGVRMSLGSGRIAVVWLVLREALALLIAGIVISVPLCLWLSGLVHTQLFGVSARSPLVFLTACVALIGVGLVGAALPAWKAAHVNPVVALRWE